MFPLSPIEGTGCLSDLASIAKASDCSHLIILAPEKMLQRLPIAFAQVKAGNTSENCLNEIHQIIFSLHRAKVFPKRGHTNIMNSIKL